MKRMNILIAHNYYQLPGGEDTVVANERKLLEEHGHKIVMYTRHNSELNSLSVFQRLALPFTTVFNPRTYKEVKQIIREEKIDIVHVHNTLNLISPSVYYAAISCGVPVVQTVHNFRLLCPGAIFYRDGHICEDCLEHGLWCAVKHSCYRGSRLQTLACVINTWIHRAFGTYKKLYYICLTEFNRDKLLRLKGIDKERVFVKPNFVSAACEHIVWDSRENTFVYAGRLEEIKGTPILFEAWKQMGTTAPKLIVCGTGPMEQWCRAFLQENPDCNIDLKGFVENEKTKRIIAQSRALILPTQLYEGFPMTILEAFSVGTPVLCSDLGNCGSIVENGVTGFKFEMDSIVSIISAVEKLSENEKIYETTYYKFLQCYGEEENYELLMSIYRWITEGCV